MMKNFTENEIKIMLNAIEFLSNKNFIKEHTSNKLGLQSQPEDNAYAIGFQDCVDIVKSALFFNENENDG